MMNNYAIALCANSAAPAQVLVVGFESREAAVEECGKRNKARPGFGKVFGGSLWFWGRDDEFPTSGQTVKEVFVPKDMVVE